MEQLRCVYWERVSSARTEALFQGAKVRWDQPDGTYCVLGIGQGLSHPVWLTLAPHGTSPFTDEESEASVCDKPCEEYGACRVMSTALPVGIYHVPGPGL